MVCKKTCLKGIWTTKLKKRDLKSNLRLVVGSFPSPVSNDEEAKSGICFDSRVLNALELS